MVNEVTETGYWAKLLVERPAATMRERMKIAKAAATAATMVMFKLRANLRDQDEVNQDRMTCTCIVTDHLIPQLEWGVDNQIDFHFGETQASPEVIEELLDMQQSDVDFLDPDE